MGLLSNMREGFSRLRIVPNDNKNSVSNAIVDDKDTTTNQIKNAINSGKRIDLSQLSSVKRNKRTKISSI